MSFRVDSQTRRVLSESSEPRVCGTMQSMTSADGRHSAYRPLIKSSLTPIDGLGWPLLRLIRCSHAAPLQVHPCKMLMTPSKVG